VYLGIYCVNFTPPLFDIEETVQVIHEVGPDHIVLGTDLGNWRVPPPTVNYRILLGLLLEQGISEKDVIKMARTNAENLLF
jgi:predicted metal-dependent TIM-barrel fold hydrolase